MEIIENSSFIESTSIKWYNSTSSAPDYVDFISELWSFTLITSYITLVICPLGVISNASYMIVVAIVTSMRTNVNFYLINLAIADTVFLIMNLIDTCLFIAEKTVLHQLLYNGFYQFLINFSLFASLFIVLVVSLEQYLIICRPNCIIHMSLRWRTAIFIFIAWGLALFVTILTLINFSVYISQSYQEFVFFIYVIFLIIVPMIVIFVYSLIARALISSRKSLEKMHTKRETLDKYRQIVKLLVCTITFFFILESARLVWILYKVVTLYHIDIYEFILDQKLQTVSLVFLSLKSSCNSLIYTITNQKYCDAFDCQKRQNISSKAVSTKESMV